MPAGFFFAFDQLRVIDDRRGRRSHDFRLGFIGWRLGAVFTLDECALFANLDLDGPGAAGGVSLLDFRGGFLHQRYFLAFGRDGAMAGLQVAKQLLLVRLGQRITGLSLGNPGAGQLLDQGGGRFIQFGCEFSDGSGTGHIYFS